MAHDTPPGQGQLSSEVGFSFENQTSPLVHISEQGTLINLDGLNRLQGASMRAAVQGFTEHSLEPGLSIGVSGDASIKRSQTTPDLDLAMLSAQPSMHWILGKSSIGIGLNWQRIDVARSRFREVHAVHADTFVPDDAGHWAVVGEVSRYRHPGELAFLDARASSVMLQRHQSQPLPGVDGLDLSVFAGRERNTLGLRELSNHSLMINSAIEWALHGVTWSAGLGWQQARFDDVAFAGEPVRRDRALTADLGAEIALSESDVLRLDYSQMRNRSTTRLYTNRYQQLSVTLRSQW